MQDAQQIIKYNTPNLNGRVYLPSSIKELPKEVPCYIHNSEDYKRLDNMVGQATIEAKDDGIYATVKFFDTAAAIALKDTITESFSIGVGKIESGVVKDFVLNGVGLEPKNV